MDEFEDVAFVAPLPATRSSDRYADSRRRSAIGKVVSRVYRVANDTLRADMLTHLLRPLGALALAAVASGAFGRLVRRDGLVPDTISAEDVVRYSSEQIRELTMFVHEVNPDALQPLVEQLAQKHNGCGRAEHGGADDAASQFATTIGRLAQDRFQPRPEHWQAAVGAELKMGASERFALEETPACSAKPKPPRYVETVIIGSGFSGLLAAIRLQKKGCEDFVILERSSELGGTWQVNSYPGAEVDIPTSLYCISFIPYAFRKSFAPQSELLAYTNHVIEKFGLRPHARTNQTVTRLVFDEHEFLWHVQTQSGERYSARFVIDCSGVLANPHVPKIKGAETFKGPMFHSGHWDHAVVYAGKRVAVIGSGCSAAQIVPAIAGKVSRLTLFMGKAQWILPRSDRVYGAVERFVRTLPGLRHVIRGLVFALYDIRFIGFRRYPGMSGISRLLKDHYRRNLQRNLDRYIKDAPLRQHMMPDYELGSRRVIPTNTYLPALSLDHVDVDISGIECITPEGIRTKDGKDVPLDIIVYATGYYAYSDMKRALSFQVDGLGGRNLNREWEQQAVSYKGITVSGYPNYFKVNGPNTGSGHSSQISYMEAATDYIVQAICAVKRDKGIKAIDARRDVQDAYIAGMKQKMQKTVWQNATCSAFYRKNMTEEVTSLSPEPVTRFILARRWFRLSDYRLLK